MTIVAHISNPVTFNLLVISSKKSAFLNNTSATTKTLVQIKQHYTKLKSKNKQQLSNTM